MYSYRQTWAFSPSDYLAAHEGSALVRRRTSELIRHSSSYLIGRLSNGTRSNRRSTGKSTFSPKKTSSIEFKSEYTKQERLRENEDNLLEIEIKASGNNTVQDWGDSLRTTEHKKSSERARTDSNLKLGAQLRASRVKNIQGRYFVPIASLEALLTKENVIRELARCGLDLPDDILQVILDGVCVPEIKSIKRTKNGCLTCQKRRIKCSEERPTCVNCIRSKRQCEGYNQRILFKSPTGAPSDYPQMASPSQNHSLQLSGSGTVNVGFEEASSATQDSALLHTQPHAYSNVMERADVALQRRLTVSKGSRCRLFTILVLIGMTAEVLSIFQEDINDKDLPFLKFTYPSGRISIARRQGSPIPAFNGWTYDKIEAFLVHQFEVTVPYFTTLPQENAPHFELKEKAVLPFIEVDSERSSSSPSSGAFGRVYKVKIHPEHHGFISSDSRNTFAMKVTGTSYGLERAALNKWRKERHPHIVELLASYNFKGSQHLVFPWAEGNLRQYWEQRSISSQAETRLDTTYWIAQQVLGLTSALKYIHNPSFIQGERQYGRHGDIKPENILWYKSPANPRGTLVIADLGLTSMHKKYEDQPRNSQCTPTYRPPEFDLSERWSSSYDIWSFGCVLSEMATWYLLDRNAVEHQFPAVRTTVMDTSSIEALREDDSFFAVERKDRAKTAMVKQPVTKWLRMLRDQPECTGFFHELLDLIEHRMLLVNPEDRIDARTLVSELERTTAKLQKFGLFRNQSMLQTYGLAPGRKIILSPTADSLEEQETIDKEIVCGSPDMPDISNQRLVEEVGSLSLFDSLRMRIEDFVGHDIDWSPLPPLGPFGLSPHTKLVWKYGNREMSIALNQEEVERWKNKSRHHSQSILPVTQSNRTSASNYTINDRINYAWSCLSHLPGKMSKVWFWNPSKVYGTSATKSESDPGGQSSKESYLCVDRCWTSIPETKMNTIDTIDTMADDAEFFRKARAVLSSARGNWIQRFLSWRSYTQVRLSKFHFLFDDIDLVAMDFGAISKSNANSICHGYDYRCQPALEVDIHMRMIAEIILHGIKNPQYGCGKRTVLDGIPKLNSPPGLRKRALSSGWGFHAGQGLSLKKVFTWITAILAFGLSFVPIWLCSISNVDLQNAFAPVTFLATLVTIILAMAAISHSM